MRRTAFALLALGWAVIGTTACADRRSSDDLQALARGNNRAALDLYAQLGAKDGNLFFSPYSISTARR